MNFAARLLEGKDPARVAIVTADAEHTYGALVEAVQRTANFLAANAAKGECVGLFADNSFFWVASYLGAIRAGCVAVPISPALAPEDCAALVAKTQMRVAFVEKRMRAVAAKWLGPLRTLDEADPLLAPATELPQVELEDLAAILFSSGSTGKPRGVMLSHKNLSANTRSIARALSLSSNDRAMQVLPFHYSFGASVLQTHLSVGGSVVIDKRFLFPDKVLQRMIDTRCTGFAGVPSHYQILLRKSSFAKLAFPDLRWLQQAGGKLQDSFVRELRAAKPEVNLYLMYGATEATARLSILPAELVDAKRGTIGKGIPGVTLQVLDEQGQPVKPGEVGEIVAEGENISRGYFQDPEESATTFRSGRLYTGDLATVDSDGFVTVMGRAKSFLKCGGTRMSADKFEEALLGFTDIVEAAVIGVPDEVMGEAPAAFVVARNPADPTVADRLREFATSQLPIAMRPKLIEIVAELPKSAAGKVQRVKLHERLRATPSRVA